MKQHVVKQLILNKLFAARRANRSQTMPRITIEIPEIKKKSDVANAERFTIIVEGMAISARDSSLIHSVVKHVWLNRLVDKLKTK